VGKEWLFMNDFVFMISFMTQSINVRYVLIAIFVPISLHMHATSVPIFHGLNFSD